MLGRCVADARQPGRGAGCRDGRPGARRAGTSSPSSSSPTWRRWAPGWSSSSPSPPASPGRASCPWTARPSARPRRTAPTACSCDWAAPATPSAADAALDALAAAGHPVIDLPLDRGQLGRGRVRALGGRDRHRGRRPRGRSVRRAQRHRVQEEHQGGARAARHHGAFPAAPVTASAGSSAVRGPGALRPSSDPGPPTAAAVLRAHLARTGEHGYHAISAYIAPTPERTPRCGDPGAAARPDPARDDPRLRPALPALHRPAPQGRRALGLLPAAGRGPPGRPAHPGPQGDVRGAHRRPGPGRPRVAGGARAAGLRVHLSDDPDAGLAELETPLAAALA